MYGSHTRFPIWNTEYGWWTNPPDRSVGALPQQTVAYYMNWAEYLSYIQPRMRATTSTCWWTRRTATSPAGLELADGKPLATFDAFEVPLYMPTTQAGRPSSLTVWGVRAPGAEHHARRAAEPLLPAARGRLAGRPGADPVPSRLARVLSAVQTVTITNPRGYFDVRQAFTRTGTVRLAWSSEPGSTVYSRTVTVTIR